MKFGDMEDMSIRSVLFTVYVYFCGLHWANGI